MGARRGAPGKKNDTEVVTEDDADNPLIRFYQGVRRDVSLLLAHGHADANNYPLAKVWSEVRIVRQDRIGMLVLQVTLDNASVSAAIASAFGNKKGYKNFEKLIKEVSDVG